ncbi:MAG: NYN domain-containing protein [Candidatus Sumerlaeota bacterium]|nr:NYN domain-containing protein [Candidatus Sumerlaeota bacterium]
MARVSVFIDGFNVYHALERRPACHKYKWLDYAALARCYIGGRDTLEKVYLFTAFATWNPPKVNRHKLYLRALRKRGVEVVMGKFKRKEKNCQLCHKTFQTFEEKLTDVNIALYMFRGAFLDEYEKAILISGDTDILPAVKMIHELFLDKQIGVVVPIGGFSEDLKRECDFHYQMKESQLARSQLPEVLPDAAGDIRRPTEWQ